MTEQQIETAGQSSDAVQPSGNPGIVYILENEAFADVVKIGRTGRDLAERMRTFNTAVPLPFTCYKAYRVGDMAKVEKLLHDTFHHAKKHWRGEFFEVEAWRVEQVLSLCKLEDVTGSAPAPSSDEGKAIGETVKDKERKEHFTFAMVGIPIGAKLHFAGKSDIEVEVVDEKTTVRYEGQDYALSALATQLKDAKYWVQGTRWWVYEGETLQKRREGLDAQSADAAG